MKISILQGAFLPIPPVLGGAVEKVWYRMGQEFSKLGHTVQHLCKSHEGMPHQEIRSNITYVRTRGYETPRSIYRLKLLDLFYTVRALKNIDRDADVIVTNTFWAPLLLRGNVGRKVFVDVQRVPRGQMKYYTHVGTLRGCSPSICKSIKDELPARYRHLVSYIPNPVPFDVPPIAPKKEKVVLFVGRLHPEKGIGTLIEAFSRISNKSRNPDWQLVIVGPFETAAGGGGPTYYETLRAKAIGYNVVFAGPIYNDLELASYFSKSSIFCYPSQENSGDAAPVAPREAMAYGAVPVVSMLNCFDDMILNGKTGLYYDHQSDDQALALSKVLAFLIADENFRTILSRAAIAHVSAFSPQHVAKQFIENFKKLSGSTKT
jgi:glycosyltransferase involved in cell wall biosynthesis